MSQESQVLETLTHLGPICSLQCLNNELILVGDGPSLKIYNYITSELIFQKQIFQRNKIHGICIGGGGDDNDTVLSIWGGRSLSIIKLSELKKKESTSKELFVGDWIMATEFSQDKTQLYCLTAHNSVSIIDLTTMVLQSVQNCNWKSILYSGSIRVLANKTLICSGTVMDGILIWDLESGEVLHHLTGHEGSIFGVKASEDGKYLVSCSDDRSIKIWSVVNGELLATGWGHGARIWCLDFYGFSETGFKIFSASEDCTSRIWHFENGNADLKQFNIMTCHTGRNIWSGCVNDDLKIGFTGGADGKLKIHDLEETTRIGFKNSKWTLNEISQATGVKFEKEESSKEYFDFQYGLVTISSLGKVFVCEGFQNWKYLFEDSRFINFSLVRGFRASPIVSITNKNGDIILLKFNKECEVITKQEIKEDGLAKISNVIPWSYEDKHYILLESPNPRDNLILKQISEDLKVTEDLKLVKPQDKIVVTSLEIDTTYNQAIIGCRFGTLLIFDLENPGEAVMNHKKLIKGDTISSVKLLSSEPTTKELVLFITMKDSGYYVVRINSEYKLEILEDNKMQRGFVEGMFYSPQGDLILYGFRSDYFFIFNETRQFEITREACGGPHRQWTFTYSYDNKLKQLSYRFIYTRTSEIQLVQNGELGIQSNFLSTGLHGREIRSMAVANTSDPSKKILITGAEDTTIKLSTLSKDGKVKLHWTQRQHVSGLQSVHCVNDNYIMSSSAREELYLWKITTDVTSYSPFITLYRTIKPSSSNPDLRVMDFDTVEIKDNKTGEAAGFLLVTVYSDSNIRIWYFNYEEKSFKLFIDGYYQTCCILNVKFVILENTLYIMIGSTNGYITIYDITKEVEQYFVINDDSLNLIHDKFNLSKLNNLITDQQLHQSSIKSFDVAQISTSEIKVVTGGDDNALILSSIKKIGSSLEYKVNSFEADAASATITSVSYIPYESKVFVTSVDQNLKVWSTKNDSLKLLKSEYTTVADTGSSAVANFEDGSKIALVGGSGFSSWRL